MKTIYLILLIGIPVIAPAHQLESPPVKADLGEVSYLGNAGLLVSHGELQLLFDPFFHNHYGQYQLVPDPVREAIFNSQPPYDSIEMILISHAHSDHFDAKDLVTYLRTHPQTKLLAPSQAKAQMQTIAGFKSIEPQVKGIELAYGDAPIALNYAGIDVGVVRIPHSGWPSLGEVSNLVYRVTLNGKATVMHMGDADPNDVHFKPWEVYWQHRQTDTAFPPYWFMLTPAGQTILANRINSQHDVGVHVPVEVPDSLQHSGADYFSTVGQSQTIIKTNNQPTRRNK